MNKNGVWTTKHVRPDRTAPTGGPSLPPPLPPAPAAPVAVRQSPHIADSKDPRVQGGEVIDRVVHGGTLYARVGEGMAPGEFTQMRVQLSRPLRPGDADRIASVVGYAARSHLKLPRDSAVVVEDADSPYSAILYGEFSYSRASDFARSASRMHRDLPGMLMEGSPVRKTDRSGAGTAGTRLVHGFEEEGLRFEIYYDEVDGDPAMRASTERRTVDLDVLDDVLSAEVSVLSDGLL